MGARLAGVSTPIGGVSWEYSDKTPFEQSLRGKCFQKSKTVYNFEELSKNGAQGLLDDVIAIYHNYCKGRLRIISENIADELPKNQYC